jgi:hypothetical protein
MALLTEHTTVDPLLPPRVYAVNKTVYTLPGEVEKGCETLDVDELDPGPSSAYRLSAPVLSLPVTKE